MSEEHRHAGAQTQINRAYEKCLQARQQWIALNARTKNDGLREAAHGDLQEGVMSWYETLYPYISKRKGEVAEKWYKAPLWPSDYATIEVLCCPHCGRQRDDKYKDGDVCPTCSDARLHYVEEPKRDENGQLVYNWVVGLRNLADWTDRTETVTETRGKYRPKTVSVERPQRLSPEVLLRVARYLDDCADELGLLADTGKYSPTSKL